MHSFAQREKGKIRMKTIKGGKNSLQRREGKFYLERRKGNRKSPRREGKE